MAQLEAQRQEQKRRRAERRARLLAEAAEVIVSPFFTADLQGGRS